MRCTHVSPRRGAALVLLATLLACLAAASPSAATGSYTLFESGQVRPLTLSPDGQLLFAVNTPDGRLEVFQVKDHGLTHRASISVGLEPVAVAARTDHEIWVVNHLSDSVSVVELDPGRQGGTVARTLLVGDEPRDIVFAGPGRDRAFITTAHRGQNTLIDPQFTTPGVGRADVWVFDAEQLGASLGGDPLTIVTLFADTPRALAVTPDGTRVYAAGFHSGNRTSIIHEQLVPDGFGIDGVPGPTTNVDGAPAPEVGLMVQFDGAHWVDIVGREWDSTVKFSLPDKDVFVIDAMASPPAQLSGAAGFFSGVGTILYNMAVNPVSGKVYVSNTDAKNMARFEGPGIYAGETLRGHLHENRITVLTPGGGVAPRHLNKHIDFDTCCAPVPNAESVKSLALPQQMAVTSDGATLYVAAMGSDKIGVFSTAALENDTFIPDDADHILVSGGGPTGLVFDEDEERLFVMTRFDNGISIIDLDAQAEADHVVMYNPEPPSVTVGRRLLYDASFTSSHGDSACASCHVFGDFDSLDWDLGNPDAPVLDHPGPFATPLINIFTGQPIPPEFHPMKGPMATQSLRGMANHGPMHWRGDRTGGNDAPTAQPDSGTFDERAAFAKFQLGFTDLLGRSEFIPDADMEALTDFILQVTYPPNPVRQLDNTLTADQQAGRQLFEVIDCGLAICKNCHTLDPDGNPGTDAPGFFGATGAATFDFQPQLMKIPHLRNAYQKVGMFGMESIPIVFFPGNNGHLGDQVRGIGYTHDGSTDTIFRFLSAVSFSEAFFIPTTSPRIPVPPTGDPQRRQLESFVLAFDTNLAPIVGQQITLTSTNDAVAGPRIDLLKARAEAGECDLVVKGHFANQELGFLYIGAELLISNLQILPPVTDAALRLLVQSGGPELTYTCVPPGSGDRVALDRDEDGYLDGDEVTAGSDPVDPASTP